MKDIPMRQAEEQRTGTQHSGQRHPMKVEDQWRNERMMCVAQSQGMGKLTDSEKLERLRMKMNGQPETVPIHREDPQAGYDTVLPKTEQNGQVIPNPKDTRKKAKKKAKAN